MKKIEYIPKPCREEEGKPATMKGMVVLNLPTFDERYELLDEMGVTIDSETSEVKIDTAASFKTIRKMVKAARKYYLEVHLEKLDGTKITSVEELETDPSCDGVLIDVATSIARGFRPGKI